MVELDPSRRRVLGGLVSSVLLAGCASAAPQAPAKPTVPPIDVPDLWGLLPAAGLSWVVWCKPRELAGNAALIPGINRMVTETQFDRFQTVAGFDLRQIREGLCASFPGADEASDAVIYVVRHNVSPSVIEAHYRARLTGKVKRVVELPDLTRVSGTIGTRSHAFANIGSDVAAFQVGGSRGKGPVRIATLLAMGKLDKVPTIRNSDPVASLIDRFGSAPAIGIARGPFEGELAAGALGLLGAATAIGISAMPSSRQALIVSVALTGDFHDTREAASERLLLAWHELSQSSTGRLLHLDAPIEPAIATHADDAIVVTVQLDPTALADGIFDATKADIAQLMK